MKRLMTIIGVLLTATLLLSVSCSAGYEVSEEEEMVVEREEVEMEQAVSMAPEPDKGIPGQDFAFDEDEQFSDERMIVRTGQMSLIVEDVQVAIEEITGMAEGFEGYVVSSRVWKIRERLVGSISIRIDAEHFGDATRLLRELAVDVASESSSSRDVTEEYVDLTSKLKNLEATEEQLLTILEKAETVEDILNVQRELSRTRSEIEQTKGRMQYLERTSATSLIEIALEQSKLSVEFNAHKTRVKEREQIWFSGEIAGGFAPYSYQWDLGDGTTSTDESLWHAYSDNEVYTVSLTVTDDRGNTLTETRTDYITVLSGWAAGNIASSAWNGLVVFGRILADIIIWLGVFSPLWIVIGIIVYVIIRRRRRQKAEKS